jgi:hypothetical protein
MPASYTIDTSRGLILSRAWGTYTDADMREHYRRLRSDGSFNPSFRQLIDLREVDQFEVTPEGVREVGRMRLFRPGTRRAFVVGSDLLYNMLLMFGTQPESAWGTRVALFRDPADAERWLETGLPDKPCL